MKNLQFQRIKLWLLKNRKVLFPVLSIVGVLFFVLCDYEFYPWLTMFFVCIIMLYALWGILHIKRFATKRDADGNLIMYNKREIEKNSLESEQQRLEQEKAAIENRLNELKQQKS